jgi:hypothetical protein
MNSPFSLDTLKVFQHRRHIGCEFEIGPKTEAYQLSNGMKFVHSLSYSSGESKKPTQSTVSYEDAHGKVLVKETVSLSDPNCKECTAFPWQGTPTPFTSFSIEGSPYPFIVLKEATPDSISFAIQK